MTKKKGLILLTLPFILIIAAGIYLYANLQPVAEKADKVTVTIPHGSSTNRIAAILKQNGLIRNELIFKLYAKYNGTAGRLQAGEYEIKPGTTMDRILNDMAAGRVKKEAMVRFTVPEGYKLDQIADKLAHEGIVDKEDFLKEADTGKFDYEFLKDIRPSKDRKHPLEGFLFPKTYDIPKKNISSRVIIEHMLAQFDKEFPKASRDAVKANGINFYQGLILASIVEREAEAAKEQPKVAGVLYNRLKIGMPLQMDSTIQYLFDKQKKIVTYDDLLINNPYNTYKVKGLPPGPIANPGKSALEAVKMPEKHKFVYFVTKKDGSGEHYFAVTYQEHLRNIATSKKQKG